MHDDAPVLLLQWQEVKVMSYMYICAYKLVEADSVSLSDEQVVS